MEDVAILLSSFTDAFSSISKAYKGKQDLNQLQQCIDDLKGLLKTEKAQCESIIEKRRKENRYFQDKLLSAEKESWEKINKLKENLADKHDRTREDLEMSFKKKQDEIKLLSDNIIEMQQENTALLERTNAEMRSKVNEVIDKYESKVGGIDGDLKDSFDSIMKIYNDYTERMDAIYHRHEDEIRIKEKEHKEALREKDKILNSILMMCFQTHKNIMYIQDKRASDAVMQSVRLQESIGRDPTYLSLECDSSSSRNENDAIANLKET